MQSRLLIVALFLWLLPLACQHQSRGAGNETTDTTEATQSATVDTPPGAPVGEAGIDTMGGGPTDTAAAGGQTGAPTDSPAEGPRDTTGKTDQAGGGKPVGDQASGDVSNGWKQYEVNCSRCHGQDALGSAFAPDLRQSVKGRVGREAFMQITKNGLPAKGMPAFASQLDDQQIADIYAYVVARSTGKLGPGRPPG